MASELKAVDPAPAFRNIAVERSTFVIGPDQKIRAILRKIKPGGPVKERLAVAA